MKQLVDRYIPEDKKLQAETVSKSVMTFLQDEGYANIILHFSEEHPDKVIEGEEISYLFFSKMSKQQYKKIFRHFSEHRKVFLEENNI